MIFARRQAPAPPDAVYPTTAIASAVSPARPIRALLVGEEAGRFRHYLEGHHVAVVSVEEPPERILQQYDIALMRSEGAHTCTHSARLSKDGVAVFVLGGNDLPDLIRHFECGADEYLKGPVSPPELLAKIKAVLRCRRARSGAKSRPPIYQFGGWRLNTGTRALHAPNGEEVQLSPKEFRVLLALVSRGVGMVLTKEDIQRLGDANADPRPYSTISRLRKKLRAKDSTRFIRNVRETGYIFHSKVARLEG